MVAIQMVAIQMVAIHPEPIRSESAFYLVFLADEQKVRDRLTKWCDQITLMSTTY